MTDLGLKVREVVSQEHSWEQLNETYAHVERLIESYVNDDSLIGNTVSWSVADGSAVYEIAWANDRFAYLRHIDYIDGYRASQVEGLATVVKDPMIKDGVLFRVDTDFVRGDVERSRNWRNYLAKEKARKDSLQVGEIIHYDNGFGEYIRCEIVDKDGELHAKAIAMVGNWSERDLPRRQKDGTIYYGYHAEKILFPDKERSGTKTHWIPNMSCIWEYTDSPRKGPDPREMEPIDLSVPELDAGEQIKAEKWATLKAVFNYLNENNSHTVDDPQTVIDEVKKMLSPST
jgi:hypothetical protein